MRKHSRSNHEVPAEASLRNTSKLEQHADEVDQSGSDWHKDKHAESPTHEAQEEHGMINDHEQVLIKDEVESDQNGSFNDKEDEDEDKDMNEVKDEDEDIDENGVKDEDEEINEDENMDEDGCITVNLSDVLKEFECPICLGIIRQTRAVKDCLHRFCKNCIEKAIRVGKNECPICFTHCASRRSLREDPNFDTLISLFFPDIEKYEEEEITLLEDEIIRNNQIQASIAQTLQRQREARKLNAGATVSRRLQGKGASSSGVENTETQLPLESATIDADGTGDEIFPDFNREIMSSQATLTLVNHHQSNIGVHGENARSTRLSELISHLQNSDINDDELEIHLMLLSLDEQRIPSLQEPFLCCKPTLSMKTLSKYVKFKVGLWADEVELCLVEEPQANLVRGERTVNVDKGKIRVLRDEETLADLYTWNAISSGHLFLAYKMKQGGPWT